MKSIRLFAAALAPIILCACATTNTPGWTGQGAVPFEGALAGCEAEVADTPDQTAREARLDACMAAKGWTRTVS